MGIHATVLEETQNPAPITAHTAALGAHIAINNRRGYAELSARLFSVGRRCVVAFGSVHRGAGVTSLVAGLADDLRRSDKTVAVFDGNMRETELLNTSRPERHSDLSVILATSCRSTNSDRRESLTKLRERYDVILIDCGSLESTSDLLRVATETDGVVLVVEAGRTTKQQLERANALIGEVKGKVLGCVLNKRRYPVPRWLYRML